MTPRLTHRQRLALTLKANGNTDRQIGNWMGIAEDSASETLRRAYRNLGAVNAAQAVAIALLLREIDHRQINTYNGPQEKAA
jgi:DNA-binding CsgD family transcriptional regulator